MKPRNQDGIASRRAVAERLRTFFSDLTGQLAAGSAELWERVQRRLPISGQPNQQNERPSGEQQPQPPQSQQSQLARNPLDKS